MIQRISGDTLAIRDSVAMTPTVQPAAAGTHQNVERFSCLTAVRVIGREDMRSDREMLSVRGARLPDGTGELLAWTVAGLVGYRARLTEGQLQTLQPVTDRAGVRAEVFD